MFELPRQDWQPGIELQTRDVGDHTREPKGFGLDGLVFRSHIFFHRQSIPGSGSGWAAAAFICSFQPTLVLFL
ncbi:MAG: hypothetical protein EOP62_15380 [Sphingomonadales bacterium]|nr:MAG: hypothetical protein EOP62_15380 [Sphingomonadales bacterium]